MYETLVQSAGLEARGFQERYIEGFARRGDAFQLIPKGESQPLPFILTVVESGYNQNTKKNFIRFEPPKFNGNEALELLLKEQLEKGGALKRVRNLVIEKQAEMLEAMLRKLKETLKTKLDLSSPYVPSATTSSIAGIPDVLLGIRVEIPSINKKKQLEEDQKLVATSLDLLEQTQGLSLDPAQKEGVIEGIPDLVPYEILQGPGGTGKTTVILSLIKLLLKKGKKIVVVAHANRAVDNILIRALEDPEIAAYSARAGNIGLGVVHPKIMPLWQKRDDPGNEAIFAKLSRMGKWAIYGTIDGIGNDTKMREWPVLDQADVVVIDEGSTATVVDTLWVAVSFHGVQKVNKAGDQAQSPAYGIREDDVEFVAKTLAGQRQLSGFTLQTPLGARKLSEIFSPDKLVRFRKSLLERTADEFYPDSNPKADSFFSATRPPFHFFNVQRRAGYWIVKLANYHYQGRLIPGKQEPGELLEIDTRGRYREIHNLDEHLIYNPGEADLAFTQINRLLNQDKMDPKDVAALSPYKAQERYIKEGVLNLALLHDFLQKVEKGSWKGPVPQAVDNAFDSDAVRFRIREEISQVLKKEDGSFFSRPFAEQDRRVEIYLDKHYRPKIRALLQTHDAKTARQVREMLGLGEIFVPFEMAQKGEFNVLSVDSSIGSEFEATIISWVRSNEKGRVGFLANIEGKEGQQRRNVAQTRAGGKTPGKLIWIWDGGTFLSSRDPEVRAWARYSKDVFNDYASEKSRSGAKQPGMRPRKRSEVRKAAASALRSIASNVPLNEPHAKEVAKQAAGNYEMFSDILEKTARSESRFFNSYVVRQWLETAGVAVPTADYVENLAASAESPRNFLIELTARDIIALKRQGPGEEGRLFLETVTLLAGLGHTIKLAVPSDFAAKKINAKLSVFFHRQTRGGVASLIEKVRAENIPQNSLAQALEKNSDANGMEVIASYQAATLIAIRPELLKKIERVIVADQMLIDSRPVPIQKEGLLVKARSAVEAALTSKSTNALLSWGANPSLFFPSQNLVSEDISAFLTSLNAATQKVLSAA